MKRQKFSAREANVQAAGARITAERVATSLRARFDPLPTLSPRRLVQALQQFEHGHLDLAARTWEAMERRDDRLAAVSAKAKGALARHGFEVLVRRDVPPSRQAEAARHRAALEFLYGHCTATDAVREDERGGFSLLVRQMADAIGKRYSVHEIVWEPGADGQLTATFRHAPLWFFEATTGKLRYKLQEGAATGVDLDPDAWLVTVGEGIMEACSVLWVYKHLPLRDWLAYSEKFGLPYLLGKTQAAFDSAEWQAMAAALRGFGSDGAAVVGGADDIVPVAVGGGSGGTPFAGLVERSERAMSILWRGADLGTQAHGGTGQGQGASLQADETSALDEDRAAWLGESLAGVSRTAIGYLFGEGVEPLAYVRVRTPVRQDIQLDLAVDAFLLSSGAPVGVADVLARYGRALPEAGAPLLKPAGGGGAGGGNGGGGIKGAASEDAELAGIERAANGAGAAAPTAAENFNPYHDQRGRFTTSDDAAAAGGKEASQASAPDDEDPSSQPEDVLGLSKPHPRRNISPALSVFLKFLKGAVSPLGPIVRALGLEGQDQQIQGMQDLIDQGTGGITALARAEGDPDEEEKVVQGLKDQLTTPEGIGSLVTSAVLGTMLGKKIDLVEPAPSDVPETPQRPAESAQDSVPAARMPPVASIGAASTQKPGGSTGGAKKSELGNALSSLGSNPLGRNINTLDEFGAGAGFSGVYDVESGQYLAYPSGNTSLLDGSSPMNLVEQYGGHRDVNKALSEVLGTDSSNRLGFSMKVDEDGNFVVQFNSGTINLANPSVSDRTVPESQRQSILDAITKDTGRKAYSAQ